MNECIKSMQTATKFKNNPSFHISLEKLYIPKRERRNQELDCGVPFFGGIYIVYIFCGGKGKGKFVLYGSDFVPPMGYNSTFTFQ